MVAAFIFWIMNEFKHVWWIEGTFTLKGAKGAYLEGTVKYPNSLLNIYLTNSRPKKKVQN
jgi:hypothetical protein